MFTPSKERTPTLLGLLRVGHNIPIMGSLYEQNWSIEGSIDPSTKRQEVIFGSFAAEAIAQELKIHDHMLLIVQAIIHGTPLRALVDSRATHSFIDEKLQLHPP